MSYRKQLVCDGCDNAVAHDIEQSNLPNGWWHLETLNASGSSVHRHWCYDCMSHASKELRSRKPITRSNVHA